MGRSVRTHYPTTFFHHGSGGHRSRLILIDDGFGRPPAAGGGHRPQKLQGKKIQFRPLNLGRASCTYVQCFRPTQGRVFTDDELDEYVEREFGVGKAEGERRMAALREWAAANAKEVGPHDDRYLVMFLR